MSDAFKSSMIQHGKIYPVQEKYSKSITWYRLILDNVVLAGHDDGDDDADVDETCATV